MARIFLKKNEERRLLAGHQWVFSNEINRVEDLSNNGEVSSVFTSSGRFLGKGFYNKNSLIAYRHITGKDEEINKAFLFKRISLANSLRKKYDVDGTVYRLVNSESDFMPGLIIDKFNNKFSIQIFSLGMEMFFNDLVDILKENFKAELIVEKNDNGLRTLEGLERRQGIIYDSAKDDNQPVISLDGIKYRIDLLEGQKTGFYLDQRGNRFETRKYVNEKSKVLDLFCNEGGFALNATAAGAKEIKAVDSSVHAIENAKVNSVLNDLTGIEFITKDVFEFLNESFQSKERYDMIILDPPSFTKSKKNLTTALRGYSELNYKAMRLLKPNSFLFTFSCSHHISEKNFEEMLSRSAAEAGRSIQICYFSNCSFDHPVLPQMPETKYLKGYLLRVV